MRKQPLKILMLIGMLLLAACSSATPAIPTPAPTTDLNLVRTEVAATVLAQVPQLCALTPTATLQPTNTPQPTATTQPTATQLVLTQTTGTAQASADQAQWVSQTVADGTRFTPGEAFTMTWRIKNVGKTTWTSAYRLRHFSGDAYGAPNEISLGRDVAPNEEVDITVQMKAPAKAGSYRSDWVMSNASRYNFNQPVYLEITVAAPSTATTTATTAPTAAPTAAPTNTPEPPTATPTNTNTPTS